MNRNRDTGPSQYAEVRGATRGGDGGLPTTFLARPPWLTAWLHKPSCTRGRRPFLNASSPHTIISEQTVFTARPCSLRDAHHSWGTNKSPCQAGCQGPSHGASQGSAATHGPLQSPPSSRITPSSPVLRSLLSTGVRCSEFITFNLLNSLAKQEFWYPFH